MRAWGIGKKSVFFGVGWMVSVLLTSQMATAQPPGSQHGAKRQAAASGQSHSAKIAPTRSAANRYAARSSRAETRATRYSGAVFPRGSVSRFSHYGRANYRMAAMGIYRGYRGPTLQCVAYARSASNISLSGNAADWWDNASGVYARGNRPQPGSVLAFTSNGRMRLGHVSVVSRVINAREIEVDHANWGAYRGAVSRGVPVVDVSANNDWTAVRVGLANGEDFGSVYPTFGFIYDRPDNGVRVASSSRPAPALALNPAPSDLRNSYGRQTFTIQGYTYDEVAEAPLASRSFDRPNRSLR
jgi:surface antigen